MTIDAEEAEPVGDKPACFRTALSSCPRCTTGRGLGLAVQAYKTRPAPAGKISIGSPMNKERVIPVRLVKGAYWDMEIKQGPGTGALRTTRCYLKTQYRRFLPGLRPLPAG